MPHKPPIHISEVRALLQAGWHIDTPTHRSFALNSPEGERYISYDETPNHFHYVPTRFNPPAGSPPRAPTPARPVAPSPAAAVSLTSADYALLERVSQRNANVQDLHLARLKRLGLVRETAPWVFRLTPAGSKALRTRRGPS